LAFNAAVSCAGESAPDANAAETNARLDTLFGAHLPYEKFLGRLKQATASSNWSQVATLIAYPITMRLAGQKTKIASPRAFLSHVGEIMTPKVINAIQAQDFGGIFANSEGVMIGDGEVWFSGICAASSCAGGPIKITAIHP
jgi:hypothetical protein